MNEKRVYRKYSKEFKQETVSLVLERGLSRAAVARDLGVAESVVGRWVQEHQRDGVEAFRGHGRLPTAEEEVRRLQRELKDARQQVEILRKAAAYFATLQR